MAGLVESSPHLDEQQRHQCEVRWICGLPSRAQRAEYLMLVAKRRGTAAADRLSADVRAAWSAGVRPRSPSVQGPALADALVRNAAAGVAGGSAITGSGPSWGSTEAGDSGPDGAPGDGARG